MCGGRPSPLHRTLTRPQGQPTVVCDSRVKVRVKVKVRVTIEVRVGVKVRVTLGLGLGLALGLGNCNCLTRWGLPCQQERVHWTGLHRLLDRTTWMVSMTRSGLPCQKERELEKQRESKRSWASEEGGKLGP